MRIVSVSDFASSVFGSGAEGACLAGAAPFPDVMRAMIWPTVTVSPASASTSVSVPEAGAGTSASTLSVEISTIVSSSATESPGCLAHSRIVPSETDSPIAGISISITVASAAGASSGASSVGSSAVDRGTGSVGRGDLGQHAADPDGVALRRRGS